MPGKPIPWPYSARIRLHYLEGMNPDDAPAIACCAGRMEIHGTPLARTWLKLAADVRPGVRQVVLDISEPPNDMPVLTGTQARNSKSPLDGWHVGDEVIVTASSRSDTGGSFRTGKKSQTELRTIKAIDGNTLLLDRPLEYGHLGSGGFRSEVANLSRNVVIKSADPGGIRGHTVYHAFSRGSISYARFAHLGKEGVLGRYPIHYHLVGDSMRGSSVQGVAVVDSHNRWITVHGTHYLVVRDCIGYRSVGHGFFMEDGTEVYNVWNGNLAVHAFQGKRLPKQVLAFDPNDGAGFWWANGRNTFAENITVENDHYGFRYDMQHSRYFDAHLPILQPDGSYRKTDVRTIAIWRFEANEVHSEGFYGVLMAANGDAQPDAPIEDNRMLEAIRQIDWTGPDRRHPHRIRNLKIWGAHYAFRPHIPSMLIEDLYIHGAAYGIYRPAFENQVYRNVTISQVEAEPFNRAMDDASAQTGQITVDGLWFVPTPYGNQSTPLIQLSDLKERLINWR